MVLLRSLAEEDPGLSYPDDYAPPGVPGTPPVPPNIIKTTSGPQTVESQIGGGGGGGGVGGSGGAGDFGPSFNFGSVPRFSAQRFKLPSFDEAMQEPGYQFRVKAGSDALERGAASKGLLRTGGTLKDLAQWNQDFAAGEYQNVANRALGVFNTNYQGDKDEYAPLLAEWNMLSNAELQRSLAQYGRTTAWNMPRGGGGGGGGYDDDPMPLPGDYGL